MVEELARQARLDSARLAVAAVGLEGFEEDWEK